MKVEKEEKETAWYKQKTLIIGILSAAVIFIFWLGSGYAIIQYSHTCKDPLIARGTFGDMFGAINALFSGLAFVGIIVAIFLQHHELNLQREELVLNRKELAQTREEFEQQNETMSRQRFENTFYNMLRLQNEILDSIQIRTETGRGAIALLAHEFNEDYSGYIKKLFNIPRSKIIKDTYFEFMNAYGNILGHYFRNLYNIVKFIDMAKGLSDEEKRIYTNLLRAQLSGSELYLLFFNCLGKDEYAPFKLLVEKYSLLKHVPKISEEEKSLYQPRAFDKAGNFIRSIQQQA